jgi:hypothetical protein
MRAGAGVEKAILFFLSDFADQMVYARDQIAS